MSKDKKFPVIELFGPTIQGEGALAGQVSAFFRVGNCTFRCSWCDSMHAVDPIQIKANATYMTTEEIVIAIQQLAFKKEKTRSAPWVTLSGGDPVIWEFKDLVNKLNAVGFRVAVETQGAMWKDWLTEVQLVTCSPKPPSSGQTDKLHINTLRKYVSQLQPHNLVAKFVVFDDIDLNWAKEISALFPFNRIFLSAGTDIKLTCDADLKLGILERYRWLSEAVIEDPFWHHVTVLPQLHTLMWGKQLGK
jgi:7-carboxy-7-deazaguanine synthase